MMVIIMAPKHEISLLPKEEFEQKFLGQCLIWVLTVGRWVVIFTEFVVICAFLSRFYLDRKVADLYDEIFQKQAMVEAASEFEQEFRFLQKRLDLIQDLANQPNPDEVLKTVTLLLPDNVSLSEFNFSQEKIEIAAVASSSSVIGSFWRNLHEDKKFTDVRITEISKEKGKPGIKFALVAKLVRKNAANF